MKKKFNKKKLWLLIIPVIVIVGLITVAIIDSSFDGNQYGQREMLKVGNTGNLVLNYNGADDKPESETVTYNAYEQINLPEVTKKGYNFIGWGHGGTFYGQTATFNSSNDCVVDAWFEKDYSAIKSPVGVFTDEFDYKEYEVGDYKSVSAEVTDIYIDGGYKAVVYEKENFEGEKTVVAYTGEYQGKIGSLKVEEVESNGFSVSNLDDNEKYELLYQFAPKIWWAEGEEYFSSTVEFAMENTKRSMTDLGYCFMIDELDGPRYMTDYFYGDQENSKAYAFVTEKEDKYVDLSYYVFTHYNKAKEVFGIQFGNHVGDWEHITVRLMKYSNGKTDYLKPVLVAYPVHSFMNYSSWDDIDKIDETHPVAYSAYGSHGMWKDEGTHIYVNAVVVKLTDECSKGTAWDLWNKDSLETYCYDSQNHTGYGIGNSKWNSCFDFDYYNENSNAVYSWGNKGWYAPIQVYPSLESGPRGPQHKSALYDYYKLG